MRKRLEERLLLRLGGGGGGGGGHRPARGSRRSHGVTARRPGRGEPPRAPADGAGHAGGPPRARRQGERPQPVQLALDQLAALAPAAESVAAGVRLQVVLLLRLQDAEPADLLDAPVEVEHRGGDGQQDEDREEPIEALAERREVDRLAEEVVEGGVLAEGDGQEGQEIVGDRDGQPRHQTGVPAGALAVRVAPHQGAIPPDLGVVDARQGGPAHVEQPAGGGQLPPEADGLRILVVGDHGEGHHRQPRGEGLEDLGPDDGDGGGGAEGAQEASDARDHAGVQLVAQVRGQGADPREEGAALRLGEVEALGGGGVDDGLHVGGGQDQPIPLVDEAGLEVALALDAPGQVGQVAFGDDGRHRGRGVGGRRAEEGGLLGDVGGLGQLLDPVLEVAGGAGLATLQLADLGLEALEVGDGIHQIVMQFGGVNLDATQAAADAGVAEQGAGDGDEAVAHEVDGHDETPDVGQGHDDALDGGEVEPLLDGDVDQGDDGTDEDEELVLGVGTDGILHATFGIAIAGIDVFPEQRKNDPT